jgi:hypothetical protein
MAWIYQQNNLFFYFNLIQPATKIRTVGGTTAFFIPRLWTPLDQFDLDIAFRFIQGSP